jgi:sec-independent protein translocase protein TatA
MPNLGLTELLVIAALALLLFGTRLPKVGKSLGEGIRNFKKGLAGDDKDEPVSSNEVPAPKTQNSAPEERPRVAAQEPHTSLTGHGVEKMAPRQTDVVDGHVETQGGQTPPRQGGS